MADRDLYIIVLYIRMYTCINFFLFSFVIDDYHIFCGDLGNDVNDEILARSFRHYPSFQKANVIRDKHSKKSASC